MRKLLVLVVATWSAAPLCASGEVEEAIDAIRQASPNARPALVERLIEIGGQSLDQIRAARDSARDAALRRAFGRASTWILARQIIPKLEEGIETQLTFDGQYRSLKELDKEIVDSLFAILEDDAGEPAIRLTACRALADVADKSILPRLRSLHNDILLERFLRTQLGILLAVFGDTHAVDAELERYWRFASRKSERERLLAHIGLANLYYRIRNYKRAVDCYEEILGITRRTQQQAKSRLEVLLARGKRETDERVREVLQRTAEQLQEQLKAIEEELSLHFYNAACSNTLAGDMERAKTYLRKAVEAEPSHYTNMEKDGDLSRLRSHPSYPDFRKDLGKLFEKKSL